MKIKTCAVVASLSVLLLVCGCGKKKMRLEQLPQDPAACSAFGSWQDSSDRTADMMQMAQLGCLRKLSEWDNGIGEEDVREVKLLAAVINGDLGTVKQLLSSGMDIHRKLSKKSDVSMYEEFLHCSIFYGHVEITRELLKDSADVKKLMKEDETVIRVVWAPYLSTDGSENVDQAVLEAIHAFVKNGFDVNTHYWGKEGCKPASLWSILRGHNRLRVTQELEKLGYNVTQQDRNFALFVAALFKHKDGSLGNVETVRALVQEGADVNSKMSPCANKRTYDKVKEKGSPEMIALFKELGAHD